MNTFKYIKPKLFSVLKDYSREQFAKDLIAGIIVAIIALPLSIALAIASGVKPEQGLYTAVVAGFFISFLGGSRVQIGGPTAAFVVIIYGIIAQYGMSGLTIATFLAGIMMILMGVLRFGNLIKFIPKTITVGFTLGIAIGIFSGQLKDLFGLDMGAVPAEFVEKWVSYVQHFHTIQWPTLMIGMLALLIQIFWPHVSQKIPGSLVAIIVTTAIVSFGHLSVATIGDLYTIKAGFPTLTMPNLSFSLIRQMISPAFTIAILASIESLLSCVVSDGMIGSRHRSNAELVGQGVGNMMSALFGGIPATGAIARTAANVKNGGRTPIAGIVHALTLLLILLFLMPYASLIPMSCLASILVIVAYNMSGWRTFIYMLRKAPKSDIAVLLITLFLTVFFDLVVAIEFGMILAAFLFLKRMSDVATVRQWVDKDNLDNEEISEDIDLKRVPKHTVVYEIFGSLFFGATTEFLNFTHEEGKRVLILRMRNVPAMDISGLEALEETFEICKKKKMTLILSHVNEQPYHVMEKAGFIEKIGRDNICKNIDASLERAESFA
ncbi:SulP family inorganic anion transporter [Lactococcus garvieae]|uniref:Sulfate transporter protein n=1 Tax=Lactococcus garvieae (strain Lg2) TaxID=420890 RepID=F9VF19_LACGL|nr:sulfate permease [Lactococcus garvieae]EOT32982.1 SulP family sulfate permease [Lactococcus garvieae ATCC 49156]EOT93021.1 SulP family sulfate permease [Lactococcus garvieae ATCC 49156]QSQ99796.1 sulfate permease [Lactococcus garvieae]BAK58952.1 sulfate transporter protein [Lactococcus garvieae ATCC 49156]BAK60920.1 sulfate transporter protein [Lactococcus garvieae Lg2]